MKVDDHHNCDIQEKPNKREAYCDPFAWSCGEPKTRKMADDKQWDVEDFMIKASPSKELANLTAVSSCIIRREKKKLFRKTFGRLTVLVQQKI